MFIDVDASSNIGTTTISMTASSVLDNAQDAAISSNATKVGGFEVKNCNLAKAGLSQTLRQREQF